MGCSGGFRRQWNDAFSAADVAIAEPGALARSLLDEPGVQVDLVQTLAIRNQGGFAAGQGQDVRAGIVGAVGTNLEPPLLCTFADGTQWMAARSGAAALVSRRFGQTVQHSPELVKTGLVGAVVLVLGHTQRIAQGAGLVGNLEPCAAQIAVEATVAYQCLVVHRRFFLVRGRKGGGG